MLAATLSAKSAPADETAAVNPTQLSNHTSFHTLLQEEF